LALFILTCVHNCIYDPIPSSYTFDEFFIGREGWERIGELFFNFVHCGINAIGEKAGMYVKPNVFTRV
jgi:hypothetical protein